MNRKAVLDLINTFVALPDDHVDMRTPMCGTSGCIAGWCFVNNATRQEKDKARRYNNDRSDYYWDDVSLFAAAHLDLSGYTARILFQPRGYNSRPSDTKQRVISELSHLFNTGDIRDNWMEIDEPYPIEKLNPELLKKACNV